jgi:hypothetical protein
MAPLSVALIVVLDCSVDRAGLGGAGGTINATGAGGTTIGTGAGGTPIGTGAGGSSGGVVLGNAGSGGTAGIPGGTGAVAGNGATAGGAGAAGALAGTTGTAGTGGASSETDDAGDLPDAPSSNSGCADGTREAFIDQARFPSIAGCAGGWSVPGLLTEASMVPACARAAGNDGSNPGGTGCTVEDICADGWHVCRGASELTQAGVTCQDAGIAPATAGGGAMFFATRQRGTAPTGCSPSAMTGSNNLHGCGNFGRVEASGCAPPLDRQLENTVCATNPPWSCNDPTGIMTEAMVVTKSGSAAGGVLCCR